MTLKEAGLKTCTWLSYLNQGYVAGPREHGNEPSGSIKYGEILDKLRNYYVFEYSRRCDWGSSLLGCDAASL